MPVAAVPEFQPIVDALYAYLERTGLTKSELCARIWGRDEKGQVRRTGVFYPMLNGTQPAGPSAIERIRTATGIALPRIKRPPGVPSKNPPGVPSKNKPRRTDPAHAVAPSARAAVAAYQQAQQAEPAPVPPEAWGRLRQPRQPVSELPRFAMSIDQAGRAQLTLNLLDADADEALRVFSVLSATGLIKRPD